MKYLLLTLTILFQIGVAHSQTPETKPSAFNPVIKMHGLVHARFESSLTDSIDVQSKYVADPVQTNFRLRRLELRADISLTDKWSGVIRVQLPELKGSSLGRTIELAYFQYAWAAQFNIRGGQMKIPYELDELTSHEDLRMIDRGPTSRLLVSNNYASYQPGLMVYGTFLKEKTPISYYAGVFNGSDRAVSYDDNSAKDLVGRLEFKPVKSLRLGVNDVYKIVGDGVKANSFGGDISLQQKLGDKLLLIVEGEYIQGVNISTYNSSADTVKDVDDFIMNGYWGQVLLRINVTSNCLRTFEIGGRYEHTDPLKDSHTDYNTITGGIGFIFLPDNDARLQLNVVQTNFETEIPGTAQKNNLMFITQLQLRI